jgi:membrane-associated phospholipid phosphatase
MASRLRTPAAALLGAALCAVAAVAIVTLAYFVPGAQKLDATALHGFNTLEGGVLQRPTLMIAFLSAPLAIVPGLPLLYWFGSCWKRRREALVGIAVVLASSATAEVVKTLSAHERFQPILGPHQVNAASFPSGTVAAVMALVVAALIIVPNRLRVRTAIVGAVAVAVVAISVMVNLWHFPSDVLGGILVPTGYGFLGIAALRHMRRPRPQRAASGAIVRPWRPSRALVETAAMILFVGALGAILVLGERLTHYADRYTTTVVTALAISAAAAALLTLFGFAAAADDA